MIGSFGWMELLLILFIVLIIFGAGKIPQLGEGLGKAIKGFKKSINEPDAMDVTPPPDQEGFQQGAPTPAQQVPDQTMEQASVPPTEQASVPQSSVPPVEQVSVPSPQEQPVQQVPVAQPQETKQG